MEITLASVLNLASVGGLLYYAGCLKGEASKLFEFKKAKVFSPSRLLSYLARPEFLAKLRKSADNPDEYSLKAFIEGITDCEKPFQSIIDEKTQLVLSLYFKDSIYSNDPLAKVKDLIASKKKNVETRAPLWFNLKDVHDEDDTCLIQRNPGVDASFALEKIAESRDYKALNLVEKGVLYFGLLLELISVLTRIAFIFKGIKIGNRENEYGVLLGSALTVYGEILYNTKDRSLRIESPQYFLQDKSNVIKKIRSNIQTIESKMLLLLIPFVLTSAYLGKRALMLYKQIRRKRMEQRLDKLWKTKSVKMKDDYKCIVCFDRPRNIIAKPCLHFNLCSLCYNQLERKSCPVCKKGIIGVIEVYVT